MAGILHMECGGRRASGAGARRAVGPVRLPIRASHALLEPVFTRHSPLVPLRTVRASTSTECEWAKDSPTAGIEPGTCEWVY
jgi:hypothetical protein